MIRRVEQRKALDAAWHWFDSLSNLQTAGFLSGVILLLAAMALLLLAASVSLVPARQMTGHLQSAVPERGEGPRPTSSVLLSHPPGTASEVALRAAVTLVGVRLREHPSTSAPVVTTLPVATQLEILDGTAASDEALWARVRTVDGAVGWVIATAID